MNYILAGIAIGCAIGATVGPVALLCIHRSIVYGPLAGITTGLGATLGQLIFATIALMGMRVLQPFFNTYEHWIQLSSSIIILAIALHIARLPVAIAKDDSDIPENHHTYALFTSFLLTISGPISIASYALFITFMQLPFTTTAQSIRFLFGVVCGNLLFWVPVSIASNYLVQLLDKKYLRYLNLIAGILLSLLALFGIIRSITGIWA